jgi:hypothetical protein
MDMGNEMSLGKTEKYLLPEISPVMPGMSFRNAMSKVA